MYMYSSEDSFLPKQPLCTSRDICGSFVDTICRLGTFRTVPARWAIQRIKYWLYLCYCMWIIQLHMLLNHCGPTLTASWHAWWIYLKYWVSFLPYIQFAYNGNGLLVINLPGSIRTKLNYFFSTKEHYTCELSVWSWALELGSDFFYVDKCQIQSEVHVHTLVQY